MSKHERSKSQEDVLRHPSPKRAKEIDQSPPLKELLDLVEEQKDPAESKNVLHWFRSKDLRMHDNHALSKASKLARESGTALITAYLFAPADMEWHGTSPARSDFILESLQLLQNELKEKSIPLVIITADKRNQKVDEVVKFAKEHDISHIFANIEYEVDELRRDIKLAKHASDNNMKFTALHDQNVIEPGAMTGGSGGPHKVFTPYHKAWVATVADDPSLIDLYDEPAENDKSADSSIKKLFDSKIPTLPDSKSFATKDDQQRIRKLWPAGHKAGIERLKNFLQKSVKKYAETRSNPAADSTSRMSPYFASGVVSIREALNIAKDHNEGEGADFGSGDAGIASWVREIAFREFYRQMLAITPHDSMNLPHNLKFDKVHWEEDEEGWQKWKDGTTGVPFVDAGMRQLRHEAWMHNRLRMNVSSYLYCNLLLDYRRGERYFAENLIDWDLANNTQGWEPSYTVFNPVSQAERNDPSGDYIRKWVPELKDIKGKAIFSPHDRLDEAEFKKLGYPKPHVNFNETKARATERFKQDLHAGE